MDSESVPPVIAGIDDDVFDPDWKYCCRFVGGRGERLAGLDAEA